MNFKFTITSQHTDSATLDVLNTTLHVVKLIYSPPRLILLDTPPIAGGNTVNVAEASSGIIGMGS